MDEPMKIVLLGKTGAGKSSLANTIFGQELFKVYDMSRSGTKECQIETRSVNGRSITLIDTPGFFDTDMPEEELKPAITKCITECSPGPHAFLILLKVERYTEHEMDVITKIKEHFSEEAFKYATVVFTRGDELPEGKTIEDFVDADQNLRELVKKCGGRCHVIDNTQWKEKPMNEYRSNKFQVEKLLQTIDRMVQENNNGYYTNEMLQAVEEELQRERERLRQSSGNMLLIEINKKAKINVFYQLLISMAGTGTGVVLGALFGVKGMTKVILKALKEAETAIKTITTLKGLIQALESLKGAGGGAAAGGGAGAVVLKGALMCYWASALVGAFVGGYEGLKAAQKATSMTEAAEMAAHAVNEGGNRLCDVIDTFGQSSKQKEN